MIILTIRSDQAESELALYDNQLCLKQITWPAHRQLAETIHQKIEELLKACGKNWPDIQGIVGYKGPGSFTGLRIGLSVANALAYGLNIPTVGTTGQTWSQDGLKLLLDGKNEQTVMPEYGAPVFTTKPKKL